MLESEFGSDLWKKLLERFKIFRFGIENKFGEIEFRSCLLGSVKVVILDMFGVFGFLSFV